jgi:hypothetical protein
VSRAREGAEATAQGKPGLQAPWKALEGKLKLGALWPHLFVEKPPQSGEEGWGRPF